MFEITSLEQFLWNNKGLKEKEVVYFGNKLVVPEETSCLAVDKNGGIYAYEGEPNERSSVDWYNVAGKSSMLVAGCSYEGDWELSKQIVTEPEFITTRPIETLKYVRVVDLEYGYESLWPLYKSEKIADNYRVISEPLEVSITYLYSKAELKEKLLESTKTQLKVLEQRVEQGENLLEYELLRLKNYKDRIVQLKAELADKKLD